MEGDFKNFNKKIINEPPKLDMGKLKKLIPAIVIIVLIMIAVSGSFYNVSEQQNAVVTMFGKVIRTDTAGLYFKIPFVQKVKMVDITTHGTGVGYTLDNSGQNIPDPGNGIMITSDLNLLDIDFYLEYRVSDPVAYLYSSDKPEEILKNIALLFRSAKLIQKDIKNIILSAFLFKKKEKSYKPALNSRLFSQNESKDATNQTKE